jgi:hypothetical protein
VDKINVLLFIRIHRVALAADNMQSYHTATTPMTDDG